VKFHNYTAFVTILEHLRVDYPEKYRMMLDYLENEFQYGHKAHLSKETLRNFLDRYETEKGTKSYLN